MVCYDYAVPAVGKAFGVLSDPEKKRRYDLYGSDSERAASPSHSHRQSHGGFHSHCNYFYYDDGKLQNAKTKH